MSSSLSLGEIILAMPKAELHIHIEGSLEPELLFALAERNNLTLPYSSIEDVRRAYKFNNLQSFLDIYYAGTYVLVTEQDFYDLTSAYLKRAQADSVKHTEIFFDPQSHTARGIPIEFVINGIHRACKDASEYISSALIMCFLRHLSESDALMTLEQALPYRSKLIGVGLDSSELGNPPEKFINLFGRCKELGLHLVAHAGEEGPPAYISSGIDVLHIERLDHGVRCLEDLTLTQRLVNLQLPLTVCPLSNVRLGVFDSMANHNLMQLLDAGLMVTINSDDPAYFGGYINDNVIACFSSLPLTRAHAKQLARNSFEASFLDSGSKQQFLDAVDRFFESVSE
jgi:adenosine deaminase